MTPIEIAVRLEALALGYRAEANRYVGARRALRLERADHLMRLAWARIGLAA